MTMGIGFLVASRKYVGFAHRSTDRAIAELADDEDRVVVSKDSDFRDGHLLRSSPKRLLERAILRTLELSLSHPWAHQVVERKDGGANNLG